jgi:hypothetical protein
MALPTPFRFGANLTTTYGTVYTVPAGKYLEVTLIQVTNIDGAAAVDVSVGVSGATLAARLAHLATVAPRDAISVVGGGLILTAGDLIQASASAAADASIVICGYLKDLPA